jgi:putative MATE family efflux protein
MQPDDSDLPLSTNVSDRLANGAIGKLLLEFSVPAIIANSVAALYNIIDRVFIGHGVGPMAMSGLALTFPLMNMAAALGALVGVGTAALVSIRLGEGNREQVNRIVGNSVFLNVVLGIAFSFAGLVFLDRILFAMGASSETLPYARQFMQIILLGNVFTHLYLGLNHIIRASGHPKKSMANMLLTVGLNLALCPLFIFGLGWGIRGAAFATVCAQFTGTILAALHFFRKDQAIRLQRRCFRPDSRIIRDIFAIGMSNFALLFCASFVTAIYNLGLGRHGGDYAIGAYGVVNALGNLCVMVTAGVTMGMQPIAGFNFGARRFDRVIRVFRLAVNAGICTTTFGFLLAEVFPRAVAHAFTADSRLISQAVTGLRITFLVFPIVGFQIVTSNFFQSIGKAKISMLLSLSRQCLFLIPLLLVLPIHMGLRGVWIAGPASDFIAFIVAFLVLRRQFPRYVGTRANEVCAAQAASAGE